MLRFNHAAVRELRTSLGLTQEAFAAAILTSQPRIDAWERNVNEPSAAYIGRMWMLAQQYGYTPTWWYDDGTPRGKGKPFPKPKQAEFKPPSQPQPPRPPTPPAAARPSLPPSSTQKQLSRPEQPPRQPKAAKPITYTRQQPTSTVAGFKQLDREAKARQQEQQRQEQIRQEQIRQEQQRQEQQWRQEQIRQEQEQQRQEQIRQEQEYQRQLTQQTDQPAIDTADIIRIKNDEMMPLAWCNPSNGKIAIAYVRGGLRGGKGIYKAEFKVAPGKELSPKEVWADFVKSKGGDGWEKVGVDDDKYLVFRQPGNDKYVVLLVGRKVYGVSAYPLTEPPPNHLQIEKDHTLERIKFHRIENIEEHALLPWRDWGPAQ